MGIIQGILACVGRLMIAVIFLLSALGNKIWNFSSVAEVMASKGMPQNIILGIPAHKYLLSGAIVFLIVGGNLGQALLGYKGFGQQNFSIEAAFDADTKKIGTVIQGIRIQPLGELPQTVSTKGIRLGMVVVPASQAQEAANDLVKAGIEGIVNFCSCNTDASIRSTRSRSRPCDRIGTTFFCRNEYSKSSSKSGSSFSCNPDKTNCNKPTAS